MNEMSEMSLHQMIKYVISGKESTKNHQLIGDIDQKC